MRLEATVRLELIESEALVECNVKYALNSHGDITILAVQKPVSKDPLTYVDIEVSKETLNYIESFLYDNCVDY